MKQVLFILIAAFTLVSCTKKDSEENKVDINKVLRSGEWHLKAYTYKFEKPDGKDSVVDVLKTRDTCYSDDYIAFDKDYKGIQNTGKLNCSGELEKVAFNWFLKDNEKILVFNNAQYTIGNISQSSSPSKGIEYIETKISKVSDKSFTLNYELTTSIVVNLRPAIDTSYFVDATLYFTQVFEK